MCYDLDLTRHARDRTTARSIPPGAIDIILTYGVSRPAREGARKYGLSTESFREIRRAFGREVAKAFEGYRRVYIIEVEGKIITAAFSRTPLFH